MRSKKLPWHSIWLLESNGLPPAEAGVYLVLRLMWVEGRTDLHLVHMFRSFRRQLPKALDMLQKRNLIEIRDGEIFITRSRSLGGVERKRGIMYGASR